MYTGAKAGARGQPVILFASRCNNVSPNIWAVILRSLAGFSSLKLGPPAQGFLIWVLTIILYCALAVLPERSVIPLHHQFQDPNAASTGQEGKSGSPHSCLTFPVVLNLLMCIMFQCSFKALPPGPHGSKTLPQHLS